MNPGLHGKDILAPVLPQSLSTPFVQCLILLMAVTGGIMGHLAVEAKAHHHFFPNSSMRSVPTGCCLNLLLPEEGYCVSVVSVFFKYVWVAAWLPQTRLGL